MFRVTMEKMYALMVCMAVCGAALFAQTAYGFTTKLEGNGVVITNCFALY